MDNSLHGLLVTRDRGNRKLIRALTNHETHNFYLSKVHILYKK